MAYNKRRNVISWFRLFVIFYVSISIVGCTPHAIDFARERANLGFKYWTIEDVTFAAISSQRYLRLCINLKRLSEEVQTEISLDLDKVFTQANRENNPIANIETGEKLKKVPVSPKSSIDFDITANTETPEKYAECDTTLKEHEENLKIIHEKINNNDFKMFIEQTGNSLKDTLTLYILKSDSGTYVYFDSPEDSFTESKGQVFKCYGEDISEPGTYVLVPMAIVADVAMIVMFVFLLPIILLKAAGSGGRADQGKLTFDVFPPTPRIVQPNCD